MPDRSGERLLIPIGVVRRPIGLRGEVAVSPTGDDAGRFAPGTKLIVRSAADAEMRIDRSRPYGRGVALVLDGIDSVEKADALRGAELAVPAGTLPALPDGTYYHYQIIGLLVVDSEGLELGRIEAILETGSNDVYCVGRGAEEILIPAVKDFVARVDLEGGRLWLAVPRSHLGEDEEPI